MQPHDYSQLTREIYHKQHTAIANDQVAMDRFINMFTYEYFGVDKNFFKEKKILDAGCGNTAKVIIAMHRLGAQDIHGFDLGHEFIPVATESLKRQGVPLTNVSLKSGNLLSIPYPDESFDFVICHGVLLHLNNYEEVRQAFSELARVTKSGKREREREIDILRQSLFDSEESGYDFVFTCGVLIHLNPDMLPLAYQKIYNASSRYICLAEYYNPTPVSIPYRGHEERLYKRDFAGEFLDAFTDVRLIDYGFIWRRDPLYPEDDTTWFLMEKRSQK